MVKVRQSTIIDAPIDDVWAILPDFNSHDRWHPAIAFSDSGAVPPGSLPFGDGMLTGACSLIGALVRRGAHPSAPGLNPQFTMEPLRLQEKGPGNRALSNRPGP